MDIDARAKRLTLVACILGSAIVFVDQTVVNVALPALSDDLDATLAGQQWVVEAYLLLLASLVLVEPCLRDAGPYEAAATTNRHSRLWRHGSRRARLDGSRTQPSGGKLNINPAG